MTRQVIHYLLLLSQHTFIAIVTLTESHTFNLFFFSPKSITTHYNLPSTSRPQIIFKLLFKFYSSSVFFPNYFSNAVNVVSTAPSQISSLSLSQEKFLTIFLYILFQSKLKAQISYSYHPIEVFLLFYFHHKFSPILLQCKSKKFVLFYSSFSSYFSLDSRTGLTVAVSGFFGGFQFFFYLWILMITEPNWCPVPD